MDKDKLLGPVLRKEAKLRTKQANRVAKEAIKAARVAEKNKAARDAAEARQARFDSLAVRNSAVVKDVRSFTESGATWTQNIKDDDYNILSLHGKVVILADAPRGKETPNHSAVCLVSTTEKKERGTRRYGSAEETTAQFRFAFVPKDRLGEILSVSDGNPFDVLIGDEPITRDENSFIDRQRPYDSELHGMGRGLNYNYSESFAKRRAYNRGIVSSAARVRALEQDLNWVLQAAADPTLNPHLQVEAEKVSLVKPPANY